AEGSVCSTPVSVTNPGGGPAGPLDPRMNLYPAATAPIGSPSIRRGIVWDLYASLISLQDNGGSATFRFYHNPGVNWLWLGGLVMALRGAAAAWPARRGDPRDDRGASGATQRTPVEAGAQSTGIPAA